MVMLVDSECEIDRRAKEPIESSLEGAGKKRKKSEGMFDVQLHVFSTQSCFFHSSILPFLTFHDNCPYFTKTNNYISGAWDCNPFFLTFW